MTNNEKFERIQMVKAMEYIARQVNDENVFIHWLYNGVADGDIEYGDLSMAIDEEYYLDDYHFSSLMDTFLELMRRAYKSGGLYCGGCVSNRG